MNSHPYWSENIALQFIEALVAAVFLLVLFVVTVAVTTPIYLMIQAYIKSKEYNND